MIEVASEDVVRWCASVVGLRAYILHCFQTVSDAMSFIGIVETFSETVAHGNFPDALRVSVLEVIIVVEIFLQPLSSDSSAQ